MRRIALDQIEVALNTPDEDLRALDEAMEALAACLGDNQRPSPG